MAHIFCATYSVVLNLYRYFYTGMSVNETKETQSNSATPVPPIDDRISIDHGIGLQNVDADINGRGQTRALSIMSDYINQQPNMNKLNTNDVILSLGNVKQQSLNKMKTRIFFAGKMQFYDDELEKKFLKSWAISHKLMIEVSMILLLSFAIVFNLFNTNNVSTFHQSLINCIGLIVISTSIILTSFEQFLLKLDLLQSIAVFTILSMQILQHILTTSKSQQISVTENLKFLLIYSCFFMFVTSFIHLKYHHLKIIVFGASILWNAFAIINRFVYFNNSNKEESIKMIINCNLVMFFINMLTLKNIYKKELKKRILFLNSLKSFEYTNNAKIISTNNYHANLNQTENIENFAPIKLIQFVGSNIANRRSVDILEKQQIGNIASDNCNVNDDKNLNTKRLVLQSELPEWYGDYQFIYSGYRLNYTFNDCTKSICTWHNETMNIWTEIIPFVILLLTNIYYVEKFGFFHNVHATFLSKIISIVTFWLPIRALLSAIVHTYHCINAKYSLILWKIDYLSIVVIIFVQTFCFSNALFYCENENVLLTNNIGWICFYTSIAFLTIFRKKNGKYSEYYNYKTLVQICLGILAVIGKYPILFVQIGNVNTSEIPINIWMHWIIGEICHIFAFAAKSKDFPEKVINSNDSIFNYVLTSHNLWHIGINFGIFELQTAGALYLNFRLQHDTC